MKKNLFSMLILCLIGLQGVFAQNREVSGVVTSADDGLSIPGVSVVIKGTTIGTTTDFDGNYAISVPEEGEILVFSFVGMKTVELPINSNKIDLVMESESIGMDEVVVTAMGVTREKKALGYAATSLGGEEIGKSQAVNPMSALQGKVAGVDISTAPGPGATQNVMIRGASSFGNNQPLYIVDGVPITNEQNSSGSALNSQVDFGSGINAINPDDIEDMTVLKGAAATALYGSRAANGVIMITTKSGKNTEGKMRVSYSGSVTLSKVGRLPDVQKQFGQGWSGDRALDENGNWGPEYDGKDRVWGNVVDNSQQIKPYVFLEDRVRDFYETGKNIKNSVSLSGGNANTNYFMSLSQNSVDGVIPTDNDSYKRYTISTKGSHKAGKVTISSSVNFSTEKTKAVASGQGTSVFRSLYESANDISIVDLKDYNNKFNNLDNYFTPYGVNPYYVLNENGAEQDKKKIFGKFQFDYDFTDDIKLSYRFGGDYETTRSETHTAIIAFAPGSPNDGSSSANPGNYSEVRRSRTQVNHDLMASIKQNLNEDFTLNAIVGLNVNERQYNWLSGSINSIDIPNFYNLSNSLAPSVSNQYNEKRRLIGLYANVDFSFRNYAYLTLTARNDWSSTLPTGANDYFYPGVTGSFLITDFLKYNDIDTGILSFAKVRAAYGMTGNDADPYSVYDRYVSAFSGNPGYPKIDDLQFPLGGVNSYMASNRLGNPDLTNELTKEFELGIEAQFFNNRLGIDFSYYNRLTEGLISSLPKDPSSGYTTQMANLGDVRNQGIEFVLNFTPVKTENFTWDVSYNVALNRNKMENLDVDEVYLGGFGGAGIYAVEGKAMGQFKIAAVKKVEIDGVMKTVVDGSGNPQPTTETEFIGKDINEKYRMGLTNTFSYKGFTLGATLDFRYGGYMYSYTKDYLHWTGASTESVLNDRKTFLVPNSVVSDGRGGYVENTTPVDPTALHKFYGDGGGFDGDADNIIDRSYLKLRNVNLSYSLSKNFCERLHVSAVSLSLSASNILLWTPAENVYIDPETTTFGNDVRAKFGEYGAGPSNEFYTFGLTFTL
ncbi:SusC/RagA family TonB-linked outer membrane protein [Ancylomarina salipaludis]|uniref:SusC/RagA family TonB-linked outer membrane protein n=1 Tax=Ancylomarina salipaludis TaxID=2501299 RepID=A0A4Q1JPE3_9BACT|nr:SusC/RagA family TonB-linked outer membrane protein [Ancylomarina salipaludis]RXQ96749.1 SusC/RagA family TonB-linked outer membrane protein [Ancylomarina salipaludis]